MEQSKRSSLSVARSILNHKVIGKKLESYLKVRVNFTPFHFWLCDAFTQLALKKHLSSFCLSG